MTRPRVARVARAAVALAAALVAFAGCAGPGAGADDAIPRPEGATGLVLRLPPGAAPPGSSVAILGSFDGWSAHGVTLPERSPGEFAGFVPMPPGEHRVVARVRPPAGSERLLLPEPLAGVEPDGFGGESGLVDVSP